MLSLLLSQCWCRQAKRDSSAAAGQQAMQGSVLGRTCLSGAASLRSLKEAREMVSSMDGSGHYGAGMSSVERDERHCSNLASQGFFFKFHDHTVAEHSYSLPPTK
jgi:hypothetical protein